MLQIFIGITMFYVVLAFSLYKIITKFKLVSNENLIYAWHVIQTTATTISVYFLYDAIKWMIDL